MKKLVLFGDSLFAHLSKSYLLELEGRLKEYDIYNCAVGGWDSGDCVKKGPYIASLEADTVVISVGTNDASPWKQVDINALKNNIISLIQIFNGSKLMFFLPPPINEDVLSKDSKRKSLTNDLMKQYHDSIKEICVSQNVTYVDSWSVFMPMIESGNDYHVEDGIHLNEEAYDVLFDELKKLTNSI